MNISGVPLGSQSIDQASRTWFPCCCRPENRLRPSALTAGFPIRKR